jgi:hypothetical protein
MARTYADKILPGLMAFVLVVALCLGAAGLGEVKGLATRLTTNIKLARVELDREAVPPGVEAPAFERNSVRGGIQRTWESRVIGRRLPESLLTGP